MTVVAHAATPVRYGSRWLLAGLVVVIVFVVARWAAVPYVVGVFHDDGIYALLARSIASGEGFHHSHLVGNPAATHYPPLYPLVLAAAWRIAPDFPANVSALLGLNAALLAAAALGWWCFVTERLGLAAAAAAAGSIAATLTSAVLVLSGALLSEPLFMALLFPALLACERAAERTDRRGVAIAALCTGVLVLARTHALALLLALVLVLLARRRWRDALVALAVCAVVQLPWVVWTRGAAPRVPAPLEGAYGSYVGWFLTGVREGGAPFVGATARVNAHESWLLLRDRLAFGFFAPLQALTLVAVVTAVLVGAWAFVRRAPVTIAFLTLYLGVVMLWPYAPWRFVWAIWPLVAMLVMQGVRACWERRGATRMVVGVAAALVGFAFLRTELHAYATRSWRIPAQQAAHQIQPAIDWVHRNTAASDVVLSDGEQVIALYAERRAAPPIDFSAREYLAPPQGAEGATRLSAMLGAVPARYVIVLAPSLVASADALAHRRPGLRRIEPLAGGAVYEVVR